MLNSDPNAVPETQVSRKFSKGKKIILHNLGILQNKKSWKPSTKHREIPF
jgi:hypothetical protein